MWRIKLQKIVRNLLHKLRKLYMNGTVIWKFFWRPQVIENSRQYLLPLEQIFYRKQSLGAPDPPLALLTAMFFRVWKEGPHTALPLLSTTIPRDSRIPNFCHLHPENRFLSWYRIPCQDLGESCFPSSGQIPHILRFSESRTTVVRSIPGSRQCLSRPRFCVWLVDSTYIHTRDLFDHDHDGATTKLKHTWGVTVPPLITPSYFTTPINGRPHLVYHPIQWILTKLIFFSRIWLWETSKRCYFRGPSQGTPPSLSPLSLRQERWMMS